MAFREFIVRFRLWSQLASKLGAVVVVGAVGVVVYSECSSSNKLDNWSKLVGGDSENSLQQGPHRLVGGDGENSLQQGPHMLVGEDSENSLQQGPHMLVGEDSENILQQGLHRLVGGGGENSLQQGPDSSTATRHIFLIRHGQYMDNAYVDRKSRLTSLGRKQAELTGQRLQDMDLPYKRIISSPMRRAKETAEVINTYLPHVQHVIDDSLEEVMVHPEIPIANWRPEHERFYQDRARIERAFRKYFKKAIPGQSVDTYEIMVCHTNVITFFINRVIRYQSETRGRHSLANCSITHIVILPNGLATVSTTGDHRHLPRNNISYS